MFQCQFCAQKFEKLNGFDMIPKHMVVRGYDKYLCAGTNKPAR